MSTYAAALDVLDIALRAAIAGDTNFKSRIDDSQVTDFPRIRREFRSRDGAEVQLTPRTALTEAVKALRAVTQRMRKDGR
jgi:hypothetical protein